MLLASFLRKSPKFPPVFLILTIDYAIQIFMIN